jgi:PBP1b-binding outer membrane lipoprotein LpoB
MRKFKNIAIAFSAAILLASCADETTPAVVSEDVQLGCFYAYNSGSTTMEWTAFKYTEKAPVKGTFTEINVDGTLESDDPMMLLSSLSFSIPVSSISSQNEERDGKIVKHFFGTIGTKALTGKIVKLKKNGNAIIEVSMNNMAKEIAGSYTFTDGKFDFLASIDVADWGAISGIEALNTICKDLHTGADGKSKLWSMVDLSFSTTLSSDCD